MTHTSSRTFDPGIRMAETLYKDMTYPVSLLVQSIRMGKIALPDIQRDNRAAPAVGWAGRTAFHIEAGGCVLTFRDR